MNSYGETIDGILKRKDYKCVCCNEKIEKGQEFWIIDTAYLFHSDCIDKMTANDLLQLTSINQLYYVL